MNEDSLLDKIKSKYVFKQLFKFIGEENTLKLFMYSKRFQQKLELDKLIYLMHIISKNKIDIEKYLCPTVYNDSDKNRLRVKFLEDSKLFKNDENIFKSFINSFFNELSKISKIPYV